MTIIDNGAVAWITGHVYSEKGSTLGSANVACNGESTITLFDGTYEFKNIEAGKITVTASLKGFKSQSKTVTIKKDSTLTLDFHLSEATGTSRIYGRVYDAETGKPVISGAVILILPIANRFAQLKEGFYEFDNLAGDSYDLVTSLPGYEDEKAAIDVGDGEEKIQDLHCKPLKLVEPPWG